MKHPRYLAYLMAISLLQGCLGGDSEEPGTSIHPCDENLGVWIREPTTDIKYSTSIDTVFLQGNTWVDKHWYDCFPCQPDLSVVRVVITNETTGVATEAFDRLYLGIFGYVHYWYDDVLLNPGLNPIDVRLYYYAAQDGYDCITIEYVPDLEPPDIPASLLAEAISSTQIVLSWNASSDNATTDDASIRYRVYRDGGYLYTTDATNTEDNGLNPDQNYCYTITAIDTAGNESAESAIACAMTNP